MQKTTTPERHYRWHIRWPDRAIEMCTLPEVTLEQVRKRYPDAVEILDLPDEVAIINSPALPPP